MITVELDHGASVEERESLDAVREALSPVLADTVDGHDSTRWMITGSTLPEDAAVMIDFCREVYPWWRVSVGAGRGREADADRARSGLARSRFLSPLVEVLLVAVSFFLIGVGPRVSGPVLWVAVALAGLAALLAVAAGVRVRSTAGRARDGFLDGLPTLTCLQLRSLCWVSGFAQVEAVALLVVLPMSVAGAVACLIAAAGSAVRSVLMLVANESSLVRD